MTLNDVQGVVFEGPDAAGNVRLGCLVADVYESYAILLGKGGKAIPAPLGKRLGDDARLNAKTYALLAAIALRTLQGPNKRLSLDEVIQLRGWNVMASSAETMLRAILNPEDKTHAFATGTAKNGWRCAVPVSFAAGTDLEKVRAWLWPHGARLLPRFPPLLHLFDSSTLPMWMADPPLNIQYVNPAMEQLIGRTHEELFGRPGKEIFLAIKELVLPAYRATFVDAQLEFERRLQQDPHAYKNQRMEHCIPCIMPGGVEYALIAHCDVLFDEQDEFEGTMVYLFRDERRDPYVLPVPSSLRPLLSARSLRRDR